MNFNFCNLKKNFDEIISFVKNVFAGNWEGAWQNIKNIFISDKTSEMTMSVVNTFLPIMSKQYLLNLKNKLNR